MQLFGQFTTAGGFEKIWKIVKRMQKLGNSRALNNKILQDFCRYKKYKWRWLVLLTVTLLNLSNNALWISYSAVANVATDYFGKSVNEIDLLATISFYVGIPMCLASTFVVDALGLKTGMYLGTSLTFIGGLVRCLSTFPGLNDKMSYV